MKNLNLIQSIAKNCEWHKTVNNDFISICEDAIQVLEDYLPSGSGIDSGCKIDIEKSGKSKVVINFSFHHMNENGFYDGWTDHKLMCKPVLYGDFEIKITGKNRNYIKEYLYDTFNYCLLETV